MKNHNEIMKDIQNTEKYIAMLDSDLEKECAILDKLPISRLKEWNPNKTQEISHRLNMKKLELCILKNNFKLAMLADFAPIFCEIWNKYKGKNHGEKTAEKIRDEFREKTGYSLWVRRDYSESVLTICPPDHYGLEIKVSPRDREEPFLTAENKIQEAAPDCLKVWYINQTYFENVTEAAQNLIEKHKELQKKQEEFNQLQQEFSHISVDGVEEVKYIFAVPAHII